MGQEKITATLKTSETTLQKRCPNWEIANLNNEPWSNGTYCQWISRKSWWWNHCFLHFARANLLWLPCPKKVSLVSFCGTACLALNSHELFKVAFENTQKWLASPPGMKGRKRLLSFRCQSLYRQHQWSRWLLWPFATFWWDSSNECRKSSGRKVFPSNQRTREKETRVVRRKKCFYYALQTWQFSDSSFGKYIHLVFTSFSIWLIT